MSESGEFTFRCRRCQDTYTVGVSTGGARARIDLEAVAGGLPLPEPSLIKRVEVHECWDGLGLADLTGWQRDKLK